MTILGLDGLGQLNPFHPDSRFGADLMIVVVALDDGKESSDALKWALDKLRLQPRKENEQESDDTIVLLHSEPIGQISGNYVGDLVASIRKEEERTTKSVLLAAKQLCDERQIHVRTMVTSGDPGDSICEAAERLNADVLVMGSRGHGPLKRALLGSVSDYCAHHAKCPVIIVKGSKCES